MESASRLYQLSTSTSGYQPLSDALVQLAAAASIQQWIGARRCRGKTLNCVRDDLTTTNSLFAFSSLDDIGFNCLTQSRHQIWCFKLRHIWCLIHSCFC